MGPEHLHLILNHAPFFIIVIAALPLLIALLWRDSRMLLLGFILVAGGGLSALVVDATGEAAASRVESGKSFTPVDEATKALLETHEERAEIGVACALGLAVLALLGILSWQLLPKVRFGMGLIVILGIPVIAIILAWVAEAGGRIRHTEVRDEVSYLDPIVGTVLPMEE